MGSVDVGSSGASGIGPQGAGGGGRGGVGGNGVGGSGASLGSGGGLGAGGIAGGGTGGTGSGGATGAGGSGTAIDAGSCAPVGQLCTPACCPGLVCSPEGYCDCATIGALCTLTWPCCGGSVCVNGRCVESCSLDGEACGDRRQCCSGLACRGDGFCGPPRTCGDVELEAANYVIAHQQCVTLADCGELLNQRGPAAPGEFCCSIPVNRGIDPAPYRRLVAEWVSLGCGPKEACCNGDATLYCAAGRCVWY